MTLLVQFVAVLLISLTSATPVHLSKKSLTIDQVLKPRLVTKGNTLHPGIASYAKALGKYGASGTRVNHLSALAIKHGERLSRAEQPGIRLSSDRDIPSAISFSSKEQESAAEGSPAGSPKAAGPVAAIPGIYDAQYTSQIKIGDRSFYMDFDTGSSDL